MSQQLKVNSQLHMEPVDIVVALKDLAAQEGNDGFEYSLMIVAAEYIKELRSDIDVLTGAANGG
jgi:hypothetical protein